MKIQVLNAAPEPDLAQALERFEKKFTYPLGIGRTFRISHGQDYPRFFRAIDVDSSASFVVVDRHGEVHGTIGVAVRPLQFPNGECRLAAYLGDLKTTPGPNRGRTLLRLGAEATNWSKAHGAVVAYGVVMDGTRRAPSEYTGRFDIHAFDKLHNISILRITPEVAGVLEDGAFEAEPAAVETYFRALSNGAFAPLGGTPEIRSSNTPVALLAPDYSACGILEDTSRAKRLISDDGQEMISVHLSKFAYSHPLAGVRLIHQALIRCRQRKLAPAMFVAIPECDASHFATLLGNVPALVTAAATIYGTEFTQAVEKWNISTSEI